MLTKIALPWGSGLGRLGFSYTDRYVDYGTGYRLPEGTGKPKMVLTKFEATYTVFDSSHWTDRSWYRLERTGFRFRWALTRREDRWGQWNVLTGTRRPPLYDMPEEGIPQRAWKLRQYFRPYQIIDWYGKTMEVISFPSPEKRSVNLMIREPNDPTTLTEVILEQYL